MKENIDISVNRLVEDLNIFLRILQREKNGKCMLVKYMAVRDRNYRYLGTLELVQNMDFAKNHFLPQKRPLGED